MLSKKVFLSVIKTTPLVSIDLIIPDSVGRILLGKRTNKPAQHYWFVPGGRVLKDERLDDAFERLASTELGLTGLARHDATFLGVYEHLYPDNFAEVANVSTHYVVLGYRLAPLGSIGTLPIEQHTEYRWLTEQELVGDENVHENTKAYFR